MPLFSGQAPEVEYYGSFKLYGPIPGSAVHTGWTLSWNDEWLPGSYADKAAVFFVIGLFLGNQKQGLVDEFMEMLRTTYNAARPSQDITVQMILRHWK